MQKFLIALLILLGCIQTNPVRSQPSATIHPAAIFGDNMVLQQGKNIAVWGTGLPGLKLEIELAGASVTSTINKTGNWLAYLPPMAYGGPYDLKIKGRDSIVYQNVMIGEVWFASGQSNMGITVSDEDSSIYKHQENFPAIREFAVPNQASSYPLSKIENANWKIGSAENIQNFSAVAFYFARQLHLDKKIAVGLIRSAWGGTHIEAWISKDMLATDSLYGDKIAAQKNLPDWYSLQKKSDSIGELRQTVIGQANEGIKKGVHLPQYDDQQWRKAIYPLNKKNMGSPDYSIIWLRKTFIAVSGKLKKDLLLDLGKLEMEDSTYLNGHFIGSSKNFHKTHLYKVPTKFLNNGKNVIAIKLLSLWGGVYLGNGSSRPAIYSPGSNFKIPLDGEWSYNFEIEKKLPEGKEYQNNFSALYNAMVNPVIPYTIKGIIWYQGESNLSNAYYYRRLLPLMLNDWRIRWQQGNIPFLVVQLPNFSDPKPEPGFSTWAVMRESQAQILKYPATGMAVTIDLGDSEDLHPQKKGPVGERLYASAKKVAYNDSTALQSPLLDSNKVENNIIRISFGNPGSLLKTSDGKAVKGFSIAGEDKKFYWAKAKIEGNDVIVQSEDVPHPIAVRYGWADNPDCNLVNTKGLPASPFRTDKWSTDFDSR